MAYFSIRLVSQLAKKNKFGRFAYYCWAMGLITVAAGLV